MTATNEPARRYSCDVYAEPDAVTRVIELLGALPRDRGYWFDLVHEDTRCPCWPRYSKRDGWKRAPLADCICGMVGLRITEARGVGEGDPPPVP